MMSRLRVLPKKQLALWMFACGVAFGALVFVTVRFTALPNNSVHYHANLAVYIEGQPQLFKGPQYYEEVASCNAHDSPKGRVHLHDNNPHVVHVHDNVVTWADLFTNLGWVLSNDGIYDGTTWHQDGQNGRSLSFILNGRATRSIAGEVIGDQDRLLVNYGIDTDDTLEQRYKGIPADAKKFDQTADPAACQGEVHNSGWERLQRAIWQ